MKKTLCFFFLTLIFISGADIISTVGAEPQFDVIKKITEGDHRTLAQYYRSQAEIQRRLINTHDKMRIAYENNRVYYNQEDAHIMVGHCEDLKVQALKMANLYDNLAIQEQRRQGQ